jgi:hypothetical protein
VPHGGEREGAGVEIRMGPERDAAGGEKKKGRQGEEKQRRKRKETSQGLMRKFIKLQGPFCKVKFLINLKP